jgi:hypothetical protein
VIFFGEAGIEEALMKWPVYCIYGKHCNCWIFPWTCMHLASKDLFKQKEAIANKGFQKKVL